MFDFFRDRGLTADDKRREALGAYLDGVLTTAERERMETQLARDANLRIELEQMRALKLQMRAMPRRRAPRSFALDPALYGRPKAQPIMQLYPVLRGATALTALLLIFTLALGAFRGQFTGGGEAAPAAAEISMSEAAVGQAAPIESVEEAMPMEAPAPTGAEDRIAPTSSPETEAAASQADLFAQAPATADVAIEAQPPVAGTPAAESGLAVTGVPEGDLAYEAAAAEAEPIVAASTATMPPAVASAELPASETANVQSPVDGAAKAGDGGISALFLQPIQIGLGIAFILFLSLWLVARERSRHF